MTPEFEPDAYDGVCDICGEEQTFERSQRAIRETYRCGACKGLLRERAQARAIVSCFPELGARTLKELVGTQEYRSLRVYEPGTAGSLRKWLRSTPSYWQSDYLPADQRSPPPRGIPHQDLEALSFPDASFDLVVSSDVIEHVRRPEQAFRQMARVTRKGGLNVFSVPMQDPLRATTVRRVDTSSEVDVLMLPAHYHGDGKGGRSLVYCDFGADIVEMLRASGLEASLVRYVCPSPLASRVVTVLAVVP